MCVNAHAPVAAQILKSIFVSGFRNLEVQEIEFSPRLNFLLGANGQGKTNLLEAIFFLSLLRPLRSASSSEVISWGKDQALVRGNLFRDGLDTTIEIRLEGKKKRVLLDNKVRSAFEVAGLVQAVIFSPDDLDLIKGPPEVRRRFLDRAAFARERTHLQNLLFFKQALRMRNRLLQQGESAQLDAFGHQLAHYGALVSAAREKIAAELNEEVLRKSSGDIGLRFQQGWPKTKDDARADLFQALRDSLENDRLSGHTRYGPQRDRLEIFFRTRPAASFASQGQKRACSIKIMLALVELLKRSKNPPLLLLDDISSELDRSSRMDILDRVLAAGGQVFITATEFTESAMLGPECYVFDVTAGRLVRR